MKKLVFLLGFLISSMSVSAQNTVVRKAPVTVKKSSSTKPTAAKKTPTSNMVKKDYVKFDDSGQFLVAFRHTCEDGSYMEVEGQYYRGNKNFYRPVIICDSEGNKYTGTLSINPYWSAQTGFSNLDDCYKLKSYNKFWDVFGTQCIRSLASSNDEDYDECVLEVKNEPIKFYFGSGGEIFAKEIKDGEGYKILNPEGEVVKRYTVYKSGRILVAHLFYNDFEAIIDYGNGDKYTGRIDLRSMPLDSDSFKS
jgi:hypothetical protein